MVDRTVLSARVNAGLMPDAGLRGYGDPEVIVFGGGLPDPEAHPAAELGQLLSGILADPATDVLGYAYERGDLRLRELIAGRHGAAISPDDIMLTNGCAGAIGLVAAALIDPGDVVIAEAATYPGALNAFRQMGAAIADSPMDGQGLDPAGLAHVLDRLAREGRRAKFLYTIATCQNPTATDLSLVRRQEILALARRHGMMIVQDNTYGEIRFGEAPPPFIALGSELTIHLGSFSKTIAPGLRIGWVAAPPAIAAAMVKVRLDLGTSPILQRLVAHYIETGAFDTHLADIAGHYRRKRDAMLAALEQNCAEFAEWRTPEGGFFIWLALRRGDVHAALDAADWEKVSFIPGTFFGSEPSLTRYLRLSYGEGRGDLLAEGIVRLGRALSRLTA